MGNESSRCEPVKPGQLWFGLLGGAAVFAIHLTVSYGLVSLSCFWGWLNFEILGMTGTQFVLIVFTLISAAIVLFAGSIAYRNWRQLRNESQPGVGSPEEGRYRFMTFLGVMLNALFLISILVSIVPSLTLSLCTP